MSLSESIYVITYHAFNHGPLRPNGIEYPLDKRFLESPRNFIYYLIDKEIPAILKNKPTLLEYDIDPILHKAGGQYLGEWSFLLAEAKHSFAKYPLFMISSRFYEKNHWLHKDLNAEWDTLFSYFQQYQWGYLPSYDRPLRWVSLEWEKQMKNEAWKHRFFPFTEQTFSLTKQLYGVNIPKDYPYTADLFCNYIGFRDRQSLLEYVDFYRPLLNFFFNEIYEPQSDLSAYTRSQGHHRNEKPFTFFLEWFSHLFFFKKNKEYFALHYDGYYKINEARQVMQRHAKFALSLYQTLDRQLRWQWRKLNSEGPLSPLRTLFNQWKMKK